MNRKLTFQGTTVVVGSNTLNPSGKKYIPSKFIVHQNYKNATYDYNDIALIKTTNKIEFNSNVEAIELSKESVKEGSKVQALGWSCPIAGSYFFGLLCLIIPNDLRYANMSVIANSDPMCGKPESAGEFCTKSSLLNHEGTTCNVSFEFTLLNFQKTVN